MPRVRKASQLEGVSPSEMVGALIEQTGNITLKSAARAVNLRCPEHLLAQVDAMSSLSGKSRNSMLVHLLSSSIQEVRQTLSDETNQRIDELAATATSGFDSASAGREQLEA